MQVKGISWFGTRTANFGMATGFLVEDAGRARAELEAAGAEVGDLHAQGGWTRAYFRAPDGNLYGIAHRV